MLKFALIALMIALPLSATEIYRWVDDKGQVHFTTSPPPEAAARVEEVNISFNVDGQNSVGSANMDDFDAEHDEDQDQDEKRPKTAADLKREQQQEWRYHCEKAVKTAKSEYEVGRDVIKKNHSGGYISADKMKQQIDSLSSASKSVSLYECLGSSGDKKRSYQCLGDYKGLQNCGFGKIF